MKFNEMNLPDFIVRALDALGFSDATEIQEQTMPLIADGADVVGLSQTGSGKTYAYGIPAITCVDENLPAPQVLIICPTRELVAQVVDAMRKLVVEKTLIKIQAIFGGSNMDRQITSLKRGAKIVVGTPGRLMDHLRRKTLKLDHLKMVVLDEADEMLSMGFKPDIETILKSTKPNRQMVMFSATMPNEIKKLTATFMRDPVMIKSSTQDTCHASIKQYFVACKRTEKVETLINIIGATHPFVSIVFCNTKRMTDELAHSIKQLGHPTYALHGDMRQRERSRTMDLFKRDGGILVATDVAARGIDVKNVDIVVNFDFPNDGEYYTHRIGRTGRAGKEGSAFTIINTAQQAKALRDFTQSVGAKAEEYPSLSSMSFSPDDLDKKKPNRNRRRPNNRKPGARQPNTHGGPRRTGNKSHARHNRTAR
ncbi:MAG: DEAD/DEAH box helicase [Firmicutes bacterium]|nr:DEAD/DEAH box helicase [Bacillota bacterium]